MVTKYEAVDGSIFDTEKECLEYEEKFSSEKKIRDHMYLFDFWNKKIEFSEEDLIEDYFWETDTFNDVNVFVVDEEFESEVFEEMKNYWKHHGNRSFPYEPSKIYYYDSNYDQWMPLKTRLLILEEEKTHFTEMQTKFLDLVKNEQK